MGLKMGGILNLSVRIQEQNAQPSSFMAGHLLVLHWNFIYKFVHSLVRQLHGAPESSPHGSCTWFLGSGQQPGDRQRPMERA